jgi:enamine deaminase RidA (YjgF/YER057c/UK114 family)
VPSVDRLLAAAGSDKTRILMMQIFLKDVSDFAAMNAVYDTWVVKGHTSPRATVQASLASPAWLIEVVCTAAEGPSS